MKPLIGLCGSVDKEETQQFLLRDYFEAVLRAGGLPVLLSMDMDADARAECLRRLDGLLLAGGNDVDCKCYGQEPIATLCEINPLRDGFELALLREVKPIGMPVLGICRGIQMMDVALGGTLYQDLPTQYEREHRQPKPYDKPSHFVTISEGTKLRSILGEGRVSVNSMHHQAVRDAAPSLVVSARADDGVIEGVEDPSAPFFVGVQWHPERMRCAEADALFGAFVEACARYDAQKSESSR